MPRCAIYARVSDQSQVKGDSIEHQIGFCQEIARRRSAEDGNPWVTEHELIYVDEGVTGTSLLKRAAVKQLISDARAGQFDVVLFKGISRFARDTVDALVMLRTLLACGVRVVSIEENFDSRHDNAEFVFTIHSALAQAESEKTAIRVRMGAAQKARQGKWNGKAPDGYVLNRSTKRLEIDELYAPVVREVFRLYLDGRGARRIASILNERGVRTKQGNPWVPRTVLRILTNPAYVGDVTYGRREQKFAPPADDELLTRRRKTESFVTDPERIVVCQNAHPPLVDRSDFERVAHMLANRRGKRGRSGELHLLSGGLLRCACGGTMAVKYNGRGSRYYRCVAQANHGRTHCRQPFLRADEAEKVILCTLRTVVWECPVTRDLSASVRQHLQALLTYETKDARLTRRLVEVLVSAIIATGYELEVCYKFAAI